MNGQLSPCEVNGGHGSGDVMKRKSDKPAKKKKVVPVDRAGSKKHESGGNGTIEHYNAVLLEEIRSQMELVIEHVDGVESRLQNTIRALDQKMGQEVELLKSVAHEQSSRIEWFQLLWDPFQKQLKEGNLQLAENGKKIERMEGNLNSLGEQLLEKVKGKAERVDNHEDRIVALEHAR